MLSRQPEGDSYSCQIFPQLTDSVFTRARKRAEAQAGGGSSLMSGHQEPLSQDQHSIGGDQDEPLANPGPSSTELSTGSPAHSASASHFKNYVDGILGENVHESSPCIEWNNGARTVVPYIPDSSGGNFLLKDPADVMEMSTLPFVTADMADPPLARIIQPHEFSLSTVRASLARGITIVLPQLHPELKMPYSLDALQASFGLGPGYEAEATGEPHPFKFS